MLKTLVCAAMISLGAAGLGATDAAAALSGTQMTACGEAGAKGDLQALATLVSADPGQAEGLVKCFIVANKRSVPGCTESCKSVEAALVGSSRAPGREIQIAVAAAEADPAAAAAIYGAIAGLKTFRGNPVELAIAVSQVSGVTPLQISQINDQRDLLIAPAAGGPAAGPPVTVGGVPGAGDNPNITEGNVAVSASGI
jgi:hypothetical protein